MVGSSAQNINVGGQKLTDSVSIINLLTVFSCRRQAQSLQYIYLHYVLSICVTLQKAIFVCNSCTRGFIEVIYQGSDFTSETSKSRRTS